jgi:ribosome-binding factor A
MTRVNELIKRELARLIEEDRVWANNILVSVTTVSTSTDLRNATVGISI